LCNIFFVFQAKGVRPDGRGLQKFRPISINVDSIKTAEGSAIVKIGNTVVVCGIKAVSRMFALVIHTGRLFESWP
jgi:exosome complex RNA-binding protein Rrp42 (RNase PH superfamily)